jgi:ribosomal protein L7/L12
MIEAVEDYVAQGQKINAIKLYRNDMERIFGQKISLREAKDYIDQLGVDLKRRGILK